MKILFISDIHGSLYYAEKAFKIFEEENIDKIVILGDILYHGPRNPIPKGYDPAKVADLLNSYKSNIIAVRGNCDSEVDQMVIEYEMMDDYNIIKMDKYNIFATHGHIYDKENMPELSKGDVFIHGHFHLPMAEKYNDVYYLNPGSITLPKGGFPNSYAILDNNVFTIRDFNSNVIKSITII